MTAAWVVGVALLGSSVLARPARWSVRLAIAGVVILTVNLAVVWGFA